MSHFPTLGPVILVYNSCPTCHSKIYLLSCETCHSSGLCMGPVTPMFLYWTPRGDGTAEWASSEGGPPGDLIWVFNFQGFLYRIYGSGSTR